MDHFLLVYRLVAVSTVAFWVVALLLTAGKPASWMPPGADSIRDIRASRNLVRLAGVLGIVGGAGVFAWSFVPEASWAGR